jgi:hypothetical protein
MQVNTIFGHTASHDSRDFTDNCRGTSQGRRQHYLEERYDNRCQSLYGPVGVGWGTAWEDATQSLVIEEAEEWNRFPDGDEGKGMPG